MTERDAKLVTREILLGLWKVHILHHAAEHPVVGQWVLSELRRHGYDISPGTLYPLLKRMEQNGWLRCETDSDAGPRGRRYYHLTARGAAVLDSLRDTVTELYHEVVEESGTSRRWKPVSLSTRSIGPESRTGAQRRTGKRAAAPSLTSAHASRRHPRSKR